MKKYLRLPVLLPIIFVACNYSNSKTGDSTSIKPGYDSIIIYQPGLIDSINGIDTSSLDQFINRVAVNSLLEIALGRLAREKGSSNAVIDYGDMMANHHSNILPDIQKLASKKGISIADSLPPVAQQVISKIDMLEGKDFDKLYMDLMIRNHLFDIVAFEKCGESINQDVDVKIFALKTLLTLRRLLITAKSIKENL